ncbi:hemolysin III family protein [Aspergillus ibericus CBS 121593]|uniref:Hemolysin-III channel protein Izh2 n=1 Tax=Aspergillus ibericus CBS 121593 TaxID=1448316 RepID=A0A395H8Z4_9EURO|nr:hemolysin-III channel protein Izh2 [Aspergillus ibericus CBS 121593]RAL04421.1 hemolysin-III channel protein Izh2 [Aspergillus ibericus CBS 121593]
MRLLSADSPSISEVLPRHRKTSPLPPVPVVEEPATPEKDRFEDSDPVLLSYDEIPEWYQDNEYIRHGYRPVSNSTHACFASWLYLHNETVNIYSHLIPAVFFLAGEGLFYQYLQARYPDATLGDHAVFAFFLLTAVICLGMSATYHTLMNHSLHVSDLWLRLDYVGIIVLTLGDFVSGIYMVFYCEPLLRRIYWGMIITLSCITIVILLNPKFQGPRWRTFRVCTFVGTGLSGFAPLIHGISVFGFAKMMEQSGMPYYLGEGALLILGALFYTMRIPESLRPGKFDIFGCSHQIFHILVVLATAVQLIGILSAFDYNYRHRECRHS